MNEKARKKANTAFHILSTIKTSICRELTTTSPEREDKCTMLEEELEGINKALKGVANAIRAKGLSE